MSLTSKDAAAAVVAVLVALVYVANVQDWWYLGSNRWAIVTMALIGANGCAFGVRAQEKTTTPIVLLGSLGAAALVVAVVGVITGSHAMLLALMIVLLTLWAGTTLRHAAVPPPRALPH
jgi:hypothetical protein